VTRGAAKLQLSDKTSKDAEKKGKGNKKRERLEEGKYQKRGRSWGTSFRQSNGALGRTQKLRVILSGNLGPLKREARKFRTELGAWCRENSNIPKLG